MDWIIKYWVEIVFGLVVSGITLFYKRFLKLQKAERAKGRSDFKEEIRRQIKEEFSTEFEKNQQRDSDLTASLNNINSRLETITSGLLSVQRVSFEANCKRLLELEHQITIDEYQQITNDHDIYNSLGGNHNGDQLFQLVEQKMKAHLEK